MRVDLDYQQLSGAKYRAVTQDHLVALKQFGKYTAINEPTDARLQA